jgi:hypothetical protein
MRTKTLVVSLAGFLTLGQPAHAVSNPATARSHTASFESRHRATTEDLTRAHAVADNVPDYCLGNEKYRMITVLRLEKTHPQLGHAIAMVFVRHGIDEEARRLQTRYNAKKISRPSREDIHVVTDFDDSISSQLGAQSGETRLHVFVFGRDGELLQQWDDVPSAQELAAVVK